MEHLPHKETGTNKKESFKLPNWIGKYQVIGHNAYDHARKLSFSLPLIATTLGSISPERAHAVEIPFDATYEQGIDLLREAARTEEFETAAMFVRFPGGLTKWHSVEGDTDSVSFASFAGALSEMVESGISEGFLERGDMLTVIEIHNHPQYSAESVGFVEPGTTFSSFAPSGGGLASSSGDTGYALTRLALFRVEKVEVEHGITINSFKQVVDPLGIWTYQLDFDEAERSGNEMLMHIEKRLVDNATQERLISEIEQIGERIANFMPSSELSTLYAERSDLKVKIRSDEMQGYEIGESLESRLNSINTTISRLENEEGLSELVRERASLSSELRSVANADPEAFERRREVRDQILDEMQSLRGAWTLGIVENGVRATLESELYDNLVQGYREVGVHVSYEPFNE